MLELEKTLSSCIPLGHLLWSCRDSVLMVLLPVSMSHTENAPKATWTWFQCWADMVVGPDDLRGLFQLWWFCDFMLWSGGDGDALALELPPPSTSRALHETDEQNQFQEPQETLSPHCKKQLQPESCNQPYLGSGCNSAGTRPMGWQTCPHRFPFVWAKNTPYTPWFPPGTVLGGLHKWNKLLVV